jgi:biotin transporter BioY
MSDALKSRNRCYDFKNIFAEKIGGFYFYFIHKKLLISLVLKKNANFVAENWVKSLKIVIITSTPGKLALNIMYVPIVSLKSTSGHLHTHVRGKVSTVWTS